MRARRVGHCQKKTKSCGVPWAGGASWWDFKWWCGSEKTGCYLNLSDLIFQFHHHCIFCNGFRGARSGRGAVFAMAVENRVIVSTNMDKPESESIFVEIKIIVRIKMQFYWSNHIFGSFNAMVSFMTIAEAPGGSLVAVFGIGVENRVIMSGSF